MDGPFLRARWAYERRRVRLALAWSWLPVVPGSTALLLGASARAVALQIIWASGVAFSMACWRSSAGRGAIVGSFLAALPLLLGVSLGIGSPWMVQLGVSLFLAMVATALLLRIDRSPAFGLGYLTNGLISMTVGALLLDPSVMLGLTAGVLIVGVPRVFAKD